MSAHRFLFEQMVRRELRQKYKGSALGVLWYLVNPLVLVAAYALMFSVLLKVADVPDYPLFLLAGMIVWVFFAQALLAAAPSLVTSAPLVRKVRFPRETIPASVATVQLATFLVMLALVVPATLIVRGNAGVSLLLLIPLVALLFCFVLGLSMAASALHAHYRDVEPVLAAALLPWFFVTPIFLRVNDIPGVATRPWLGDVLLYANPVAPFVNCMREIVYAGTAPPLSQLAYVAAAGVVALVGGLLVFRRMERDLAVIL